MICKVMDRNRIVHYKVIGFSRPVLLCMFESWARLTSPVHRKRAVDCMACLVRFASLAWCGHGSGEVVRIDPQFYGRARRQCGRCAGTT